MALHCLKTFFRTVMKNCMLQQDDTEGKRKCSDSVGTPEHAKRQKMEMMLAVTKMEQEKKEQEKEMQNQLKEVEKMW